MRHYRCFLAAVAVAAAIAGCSKEETAKKKFDEVIAAAEKVQSYQYKLTHYSKEDSAFVTDVFVKSPGVSRRVDHNGNITIQDGLQRLGLFHDQKKAIVATIERESTDEVPGSFAEQWQLLAQSFNLKLLGEKMISGKKAIGFHFTPKNRQAKACDASTGCTVNSAGCGIGADREITLWVDAETKLPIEQETIITVDDPFFPAHRKFRQVDSDFVYNVTLDESLFSLTPPEGYTVEEMTITPPAKPTEEDFVANLKVWAELNSGQFPDELTMLKMMALKFDGDTQKMGDTLKTLDSQVLGFAREQHRQKRAWKYWGSGVKLGEKEKLVYWYQPAEGQPYRVVYGDLSVREMPKKQLPTTQPTSKPAAK